MAGPYDPFTPGETKDPTAGLPPQDFESLRSQWQTFLGDPRSQGALLSAGLTMMQSPGWGGDAGSQFGQALNAAGAGLREREAADLKQSEAASRQELRGAQAGAAEARAGAAGARSDASATRAQLEREKLEALQGRNLLGNRIRAQNLYAQYVKDWQKRNDPLTKVPGAPDEPLLDQEEWIARNPLLSESNLVAPTRTTPGAQNEAPQIGEVRRGYRFKGGDASKPDSWEKVR